MGAARSKRPASISPATVISISYRYPGGQNIPGGSHRMLFILSRDTLIGTCSSATQRQLPKDRVVKSARRRSRRGRAVCPSRSPVRTPRFAVALSARATATRIRHTHARPGRAGSDRAKVMRDGLGGRNGTWAASRVARCSGWRWRWRALGFGLLELTQLAESVGTSSVWAKRFNWRGLVMASGGGVAPNL